MKPASRSAMSEPFSRKREKAAAGRMRGSGAVCWMRVEVSSVEDLAFHARHDADTEADRFRFPSPAFGTLPLAREGVQLFSLDPYKQPACSTHGFLRALICLTPLPNLPR